MADLDAFQLNISGVEDLVNSETNKLPMGGTDAEGVSSDLQDELDLPMEDDDLLELKRQYENKSAPYMGKIEPRQKQNKTYLLGTQKQTAGGKTIPSNLLFEATATFVPQALAKNPEPVVWSDNTDQGKLASNDIKTMLQFHADILCLRKKLGVMVWHWSIYFTAVMKHGWNKELNDIISEIRKPKNFVLDPDGYVDEFGDYKGSYLGERIQCSAEDLIALYPEHEEYITALADNKLGTLLTRTEWWNDTYCFTTLEDKVLDKHKNEFFKYDTEEGKGENHFAQPKMPYTFLSVFSLQDQPHDFTNLIEQNISNQDRINTRDSQIEKNLAHGNNSIVVSDTAFTSETAHEAANALEQGDPILASGNIENAIKRIPANPLPNGVLESQNIDKDTLRSIYGTQGLTAQQPNEDTTARGMILNQSHDSSRIGGGIGDALEQVADNIFNWWLQLYYVFYDEKHYAAIMGQASAVEYVGLVMMGEQRKFVVSVAPNSMQPKDELTEVNQAIQLWESKAIDPIGLYKKLNDPDPMATAKRVAMWTTNPQLYMITYFPETGQPQDSANPPNPPDAPPAPEGPDTLSAEPANAQLSQVPLPQ